MTWQQFLLSFSASFSGGALAGALVSWITNLRAMRRIAREEEQRLGIDPKHNN